MLDFEKITSIYICNMAGEQLYVIDGIDETTVSLVRRLNGQYDLEFDVIQTPDETNISYESIQEGMYLYVDDVGYFKLRNPQETITSDRLTKHVVAHSCDAELDDKNLNIEINMGTETSQEYLVTYHETEDEILVDPRSGIPYDWIVLYNTFPAQLQALYDWLVSRGLNGIEALFSVNDPDYAYFESMLALIPRLKSKLMAYDESMKDLADVVTYEEVIDGETTTTDYMLQSFVSSNANEDGETISMTLSQHLGDRIQYLKQYFTTYGPQLSLLDIVCSKTGNNWSVGKVWGLDLDTPDYTLANTHYQFEIEETIYSFLTSTLAEKLESVVNFDIMHKRINVTPVEHLGDDTGVVLSYNGLLNKLDLTTDEDTLCTRLDVRGGNDITLEQVNCGEPYVVDIDYKLGARNSAGQRIYVSDELAEKYARYKSYREHYVRPAYVEMSRAYNKLNEDRNELIYRVPNDCVATDWGTFSDEDLEEQVTGYNNLLIALLQCYAEDYGMPSDTNTYWQRYEGEQTLEPWMCRPAFKVGDIVYYPRKAKIQTTMYWWDYYAYNQTITQIHVAQSARKATNDETGYSYRQLTDESLRDMIDAWETEWTLYGTTELGVKIAAYDRQLQTLVDGGAVIRKHYSYADAANYVAKDANGNDIHLFSTNQSSTEYLPETKYYRICQILASGQLWLSLKESDKQLFISQDWFNYMRSAGISPYNPTPEEIDIYTWDQLTATEQGFYGNVDSNYYYNEYKKIWEFRQDAKKALEELTADTDMMQSALDALQAARDNLAQHVVLESYRCQGVANITKPAGKVVSQLTSRINAIDRDLEKPENINTTAGRRLQTQRSLLVASKTLELDVQELFSGINTALQKFNGMVNMYQWVADPAESFTAGEAKTIHLLYRDAEYTNENILTTSLNNTIDTIDVLEELYADACEQVSIVSRPQLNFEVEAENMFAIEDLAPFWEQFQLGNYFYVEYRDGTFVKVRMVEYGYNPFIPFGGMTLRFSTMVRSKTKVTDLESVLGMSSSSRISSFGGGQGSSGQDGNYGTNLNVAISDTMLGKLLGMGSGTTLSNALTSFMVEPSTSAVRRISDALRREVDNFVNAATAAGFTLLAKQSAKTPMYQGLKSGATIVSADCLEGGVIRSQDKYTVANTVLPYFMAAAEDDAPFSTDSEERTYLTAQQYDSAIAYLKSLTGAAPAWSSLSVAQKGWFGNLKEIYDGFVAKDYLHRTYNVPVSWFDLNNGTFSYARGGLTYNPGTGDEIGQMTLRGIINATGGDLGGVKIGSASVDDLQSGALYLGAQGMYKIDRDSNARVVSEFHLRPTTSADTSMLQHTTSSAAPIFQVTHDDDMFLLFKRQSYSTTVTGNPYINDMYVSALNHGGYCCRHVATSNDGTEQTNDIILYAKEGAGYFSGWVQAKSFGAFDNITCNATRMVNTGSATYHKKDTFFAAPGSGYGSGTSVVKTLPYISGQAPDDAVNNNNNNFIKIAYSAQSYAAMYSNGNIRATGYIRCAGAYANEMGLTGNDYAEYFEWEDHNASFSDRRGRFVVLNGTCIRLARPNDTDILGVISATPTITGAHDLGEWRSKYLRDEFGAILYEEVSVPDAYDKDGKLLSAAHTDWQPIVNPDYDPDREYIPRSERPEWAIVGLVGQIIMLQDGSCYPNNYCKSADDGIATKSDERTNFRVMKRIDDRHILVMAK